MMRHTENYYAYDKDNLSNFTWFIDLVKKVLSFSPNYSGNIEGSFACKEASYFNEKVNKLRISRGELPLDDHDHNPVFSISERNYAIKEIAKEIENSSPKLSLVSSKPNEFIYGKADNIEEQIKYSFENGEWIITPGSQVNAVIIDPAGKLIEIRPGPIVNEYGSSGSLRVRYNEQNKENLPKFSTHYIPGTKANAHHAHTHECGHSHSNCRHH